MPPLPVTRIGFGLPAGFARTRVCGRDNAIVEYRYTDGKPDRFSAHAVELVRLKVDVIVTGGGSGTRPAKEATSTIPIVMSQDDDPVGNGLVASLARPGGNITGLATLSPELSGKRLEILKEAVPKLSRVAVFVTPSGQDNARALRGVELAAGVLGVKLQHVEVLDSKDIELAFRAASKGRAEAMLSIMSGPVAASRRTQVAELAVKSRLSGDVPQARICGRWRPDELRRQLPRLVPARRYVRGQNSERREARGTPGGAAEEIRVHHQSQSREADRVNNSTKRIRFTTSNTVRREESGVNRDSEVTSVRVHAQRSESLNGKTGEKRRSKYLGISGTGSQVIVVYDQLIDFEGSLIRIYEPVIGHVMPGIKLGFGHAVCAVSRG